LATPLFDDSGKARGGIAALVDISERKAAEAHQQVLLYELQHRVKNIIATIGALATRIARSSGSLKDFSEVFLGHLRAMASTHDLLSRTNWTGADLRQLLETIVRGQTASAFSIDGSDVVLAPNTASTLGMVFNELMTNALKHGALSAARGRVEVSWRTLQSASGDRLSIEWQEIDGPAVPQSLPEGFGTNFIKRSLEYELQGSAVPKSTSEGLRWLLEFPAAGNVQRG
jgi:two-component system CheB/CheR fusion protein